VLGTNNLKTVKEVVETAKSRTQSVMGEPTDYVSPEFRDSLVSVAGTRGEIDNRKLGNWLRSVEGRIVNGLRIKKGKPDAHSKTVTWGVF
jgi:hypothetical protein